MSEWWTYRPDDFLLFSERVYWRLFELHNAAVWPAQVPAILLGLAVLYLALRRRPWSNRLVALALAAAWLFVAWTFLWKSYATINWAARYLAPLFLLEALLLAWIGALQSRLVFSDRATGGSVLGLSLFLYALALHPFVAVVAGRPIGAGEVFAIAPDPTAIGTIGLLAAAHGTRITWLLLIVPIGWCIVSGATLLTMGAMEAWLPLAAVPLAIVARLWVRKDLIQI